MCLQRQEARSDLESVLGSMMQFLNLDSFERQRLSQCALGRVALFATTTLFVQVGGEEAPSCHLMRFEQG